MVLNGPDDTVITRHPLALAIVRPELAPAIAFLASGSPAERRHARESARDRCAWRSPRHPRAATGSDRPAGCDRDQPRAVGEAHTMTLASRSALCLLPSGSGIQATRRRRTSRPTVAWMNLQPLARASHDHDHRRGRR